MKITEYRELRRPLNLDTSTQDLAESQQGLGHSGTRLRTLRVIGFFFFRFWGIVAVARPKQKAAKSAQPRRAGTGTYVGTVDRIHFQPVLLTAFIGSRAAE